MPRGFSGRVAGMTVSVGVMTTGALGVVDAWQRAVNDGSVTEAETLTADQVEVLGPRGEGRMPGRDVGAWMVRSGFRATPQRWFCGGDGTVVVELDARWVDNETGRERGRATVATHFKVEDGVVLRIARHDDGLEIALNAAGLQRADEVLHRR